MELGGNSLFIIFDDTDIDTALNSLIFIKTGNPGQACISANWVFIQRGIYEIMDRFKTLRIGDGFDPQVTIGHLTVPQGVEKAKAHRLCGIRPQCGDRAVVCPCRQPAAMVVQPIFYRRLGVDADWPFHDLDTDRRLGQ